jgi:hypothetical protein
MIWFFSRGHEQRACETRLAADSDGFELIINDGSGNQIEHFQDLGRLLSREHEVLAAWRAQGWRPAVSKGAAPHPVSS